MLEFARCCVRLPEQVMDDEAGLIELARTSPEAFAELYRRHLPAVYRYLLAMLANPEDASDVTQQTFIQALVSLPKYQARGPFEAWLLRIARNAARDRRRKFRPVVPWGLVPEHLQPLAGQDPEELAALAEELEALHTLVLKLPTDKRDLIALRFGVGLSCAEIAQITGKRAPAIRKQLERIVQRLRKDSHEGTI